MKVKITKVRFALTEKQRTELIELASNKNYQHGLMIKLQLLAGLRVNELINLTVTDLVLSSDPVVIVQEKEATNYNYSFKTKTKRSNRIIPITKELARELRAFIGDRKTGYVFRSRKKKNKGLYWKNNVIDFVNRYALECSSIRQKIGTHCLRRTFASLLIKDHDIVTVSKLLGHSSTKTTLHYLFEIQDQTDFNEIRKTQEKMLNSKRKK